MLTPVELCLLWIAIGLSVSIASWVWPFRRGVPGLLWATTAAIAGALVAGAITVALAGQRSPGSLSFLTATAGAFLGNIVAHVVWSRMAHHRVEQARRW